MSRKLDISALAAKAESGNNSSVRRIEALEIAISDLVFEEPFKSLFAIRENIKARKVATDPEMAAAVRKGELSINRGYNAIREREKRATAQAESQRTDGRSEGDPPEVAPQQIVNSTAAASVCERVSEALGTKVEVTYDKMGQSGHVSLWFEDQDQLDRLVNLICSPRIMNLRDREE